MPIYYLSFPTQLQMCNIDPNTDLYGSMDIHLSVIITLTSEETQKLGGGLTHKKAAFPLLCISLQKQ